ncbi:MAG: Ig-like domain-containing protein, partial [bacterium]
MYKSGKAQILGLAMFVMLVSVGSLYAGKGPDCEMGDAVFRHKTEEALLGVGFHHAGIYFCSHSKGDEVYVETTPPYYINITDSDIQHSVIEAVGYNGTLSCQPFIKSYINFPGGYKGGYNSGDLTARKRRQIIATAWEQKGKKYVTGNPEKEEKPEDIKKPGASFRCDGLVEYCYEVIGYEGETAKGNRCMGFFGDGRMGEENEEKNCWLSGLPGALKALWAAFFVKKDAFYPKSLMVRMAKVGGKQVGKPPEVTEFKVYDKNGKEVKQCSFVSGKLTIKAKVTDGNGGSGIDRVEFYWSLSDLVEKKIGTNDGDADVGTISTCEWEPGLAFAFSKLYVKTYDRAGNKTEKGRRFWLGSPYHVEEPFEVIIDNEPPQVASTKPANGQTKVYLGNRIRITFSEEMGTETINENTILLNNGAVVGSVSYNPDIRSAFFTPTQPLNIGTNYTILVKSGETGVKDLAGNPLEVDYTSSFTTVTDLIPGKVIEVPVCYTDESG